MAQPKEGTLAPAFELPDDSGETVRLKDLRGKPVVLYFYPKDDTPGCTKEACGFRDDYGRLSRAGAVVLGVSPDSPRSHTAFKEKFDLPFPLLADEDKKVCKLYGVWGKKKFAGHEYMGVRRTTFLIGPNGKIIRVFENVKPEGHSQEILAALAG